MLTRVIGNVLKVTDWDTETQELSVQAAQGDIRQAINYVSISGIAIIGDSVLLNTTAQSLGLGTGGYDFVIANLTRPTDESDEAPGHIIKGRYLPCQQSVLTLEEQPQFADIWDQSLKGFPVLVGQLHSQILPAAAGLKLRGATKVAYIMTDTAALPIAFSRLVRQGESTGLLAATLTCGQAFGGDYEVVTLHSALLAARHLVQADAAIVCQGPGNAGTGTRYGFSGIEQAQNLDIVNRLAGTAYAIARMSSADLRPRHQGISHHTRTALEMAYSSCLVPLPLGSEYHNLPSRHSVVSVDDTQSVRLLLDNFGIRVTSMGRAWDDDPLFFEAAAAAGLAVQNRVEKNERS